MIVGAGINGVTAAIELKKRGHDVVLVDPGPLPHPLAASTDISKAVRAAYGADEEYAELAERSIKIWRPQVIQCPAIWRGELMLQQRDRSQRSQPPTPEPHPDKVPDSMPGNVSRIALS